MGLYLFFTKQEPPTRTTSQIDDAAARAALFIFDDAPKQAWRWQKEKADCSLAFDETIILSSSGRNRERLWFIGRCEEETRHSQPGCNEITFQSNNQSYLTSTTRFIYKADVQQRSVFVLYVHLYVCLFVFMRHKVNSNRHRHWLKTPPFIPSPVNLTSLRSG